MGEVSFGASAEETLAGDATIGGSQPAARHEQNVLRRGDAIGRYVVLEQIGVGGMGVVHAAYDPELDRKVAIKVLVPRDGSGPESVARRRLLREAQAMARIRHPNVVAVHDAGVHGERVFVAMEFVEGSTLTAWLRAQPRSVREIVALFVQAGRGLAAAHARGVVHRDFKPDNVMVGDDEGMARAQVMDFGLARGAETDEEEHTLSERDDEGLALSPSPPMSSTLTRVGQIVGTPRFMAPEQHVRGPVDARTDQFSFCVALWLALFGTHPFGGETPTELAGRVLAGSLVEPPSVPGVGSRLRRALRRGLRPEREERWPSMDALLLELTHDPTRARRRLLWAAAAVAVVGGGVGLQQLSHARAVAACERQGDSIEEVWNDQARARVRQGMVDSGITHGAEVYERLEPWVDRFAQGWADARTEVCTATEIEQRWSPERGAVAEYCLDGQRQKLSVFLDILAGADRDQAFGAVGTISDMVAAAPLCTDEQYLAIQPPAPSPTQRNEQRELWAELTRAWGLMAAHRTTEARAVFEALQPRLESLGRSPLTVTAQQLRAWLAQVDGRFDEATAEYRRAYLLSLELGLVNLAQDTAVDLAALQGSMLGDFDQGLWWLDVAGALSRRMGLQRTDPTIIAHTNMRVTFEMAKGNRQEALELAERAVSLGEEVFGPEHPRMADLYGKLGYVRGELGDYDVAIELLEKTVAMQTAALGREHPDVSTSLGMLGETLRQVGRGEEALAAFERSLAIAEQVHPPDGPALVPPLTNLGLMLQELGRTDEALVPISRAFALEEKNKGPEAPTLMPILINLGNIHQSKGELEQSKQDFERALRIIDATGSPDSPVRGIALTNLANTEVLLGDEELAATHFEEALAHLERTLGADHPNVGIVAANLANVLVLLERFDEARVSYQRALDLAERTHGSDHPDVAFAVMGLSEVEQDAGNLDQALSLAERALRIRESSAVPPHDLAMSRMRVALVLDQMHRDPARARQLAQLALPVVETDRGKAEVASEVIEQLQAIIGPESADSLGEPERVR